MLSVKDVDVVDMEIQCDAKEEEEAVQPTSGGGVVAQELADLALAQKEDEDNLLVYSCVANDHKTHLMAYQVDMASQPMMAMASDRELFVTLNKTFPEWIKVDDLDEKCSDMAFHRICDLLFALWADGVVETKQHH